MVLLEMGTPLAESVPQKPPAECRPVMLSKKWKAGKKLISGSVMNFIFPAERVD